MMNRWLALALVALCGCNEAFADRLRHKARGRGAKQGASAGAAAPAGFSTQSLSCDGVNERTDSPTSMVSSLDNITDEVISVWVKPTAWADNDGWYTRDSSQFSLGGEKFWKESGSASGALVIHWRNDQVGTTGEWTSASGVVELDVWQHYFLEFDGGGATDSDKLKIYKDGTEITGGGTFTSSPIPGDTLDYTSGSRHVHFCAGQLDSAYYNGLIDDVAIWANAQLGNAPTAAQAYNGGTPFDLRDLYDPTFYFTFEETWPATFFTGVGVAETTMTHINMDSGNLSTDVPGS